MQVSETEADIRIGLLLPMKNVRVGVIRNAAAPQGPGPFFAAHAGEEDITPGGYPAALDERMPALGDVR